MEALDELKQFAQNSRPAQRDIIELNMTAFCSAWKAGDPLPCFVPPTKSGNPGKPRYLGPQKLNHVLNSPLSPDMYETAHGVQEIIVRFLRDREEEVRLRIARLLQR